MMDTILITGAGPNGVTGRRLKYLLEDKYHILSPSSKELDLTNLDAVDCYFKNNHIDYVIHSALFSESRPHDASKHFDEIESNLRMYYNLAKFSGIFKKMFYFGSGAEYDKTREIVNIKEEQFGICIPKDRYGFIKYILNLNTIRTNNIYNLRIFGTFNPFERHTKNVVSNLCAKAILNMPLVLMRNCRFSFIDIDDVAKFIDFGISTDLQYHDYNMASCNIDLKSIADIINFAYCKGRNAIVFNKPGYNREYTASCDRLKKEFNQFTPIEKSISKIFNHLNEIKSSIDVSTIDSRWS